MATPQELGNHLAQAINTGEIDIALALIQELVSNDAEININLIGTQHQVISSFPAQMQPRAQHPAPFDVQQHMAGQQFYPTAHNLLLDSSAQAKTGNAALNPLPARKAQPSMQNGVGIQAYGDLPRNYMQPSSRPRG